MASGAGVAVERRLSTVSSWREGVLYAKDYVVGVGEDDLRKDGTGRVEGVEVVLVVVK